MGILRACSKSKQVGQNQNIQKKTKKKKKKRCSFKNLVENARYEPLNFSQGEQMLEFSGLAREHRHLARKP